MDKQLLCKNEAWNPRNPCKAVYSACLQSPGTCSEMRCRNQRIPGNSQATSPGRCSAKDQENLPQIRWKMRAVPRLLSSLLGPTWHAHSAHIPVKVHLCEHAQHTPQTTWEMRTIPRVFSNLPRHTWLAHKCSYSCNSTHA